MHGKKILSILLTATLLLGVMGIRVNASSLDEAQQKANELESKKNAVKAEQTKLSEQLNQIVEEMEQAKSDIEKKQEEISQKTDELMQAQVEENNQYESMKKRIKYMYENGNTQFIETLFESKSIGEFLNNAEYISQISEYDRNMLVEFQKIVKSVEEQRKALEEENKKLEELQNQLLEQQKNVETLITEKSAEISNIDAEIGENASKLAALKEEAARQQRFREEAAAAAAAAASGSGGGGGGSSSQGPSYSGGGSGVLQNPCPSAYISSEFGGRNSPGGIGSTNHKGRDYAAGQGAPIYAAASGTVTTVGYNGARGNYVQISHGNGLSTLYQHCSAVYVSQGQSVSAGTNIAAVGSTGASTGPHLHFEVWEGGTPVDPRNYL